MLKSMKLTKGNVSRLLTKAGHQKSTSYATRIRGWRNNTAGFSCCEICDGTFVRVDYDTGSSYRLGKKSELLPYAATLEPHFDVAFMPGKEDEGWLRVAAKQSSEETK
jgi:hypothetical protein